MAGEILIFDAAASNLDGTDPGTALNIGPGTNYGLRAFDAPAPPQTVQYAGSVDTEGSLPASRKHENRLISLTVLCATAAALRTLQGKIGKVGREGGTLKWVLPNAETVIFDLLAADTFAPTIDKLLYVRAGAFCEVQITLPTRPYGRGVEIDLGDNATTTLPVLIFTEASIPGDVEGLGRLVIDNDEPFNDQKMVLLGLQQRYYSSASTAALFYEAESADVVYKSIVTGPAGASGGATNNTVKDASLSTSFAAQIELDGTHVGIFRVFARVQAAAANAGTTSMRLFVRNGLTTGFLTEPVSVLAGNWQIVEFGQVIVPKPKGTPLLTLIFEAKSTVAGDDLYWDWVMLLPIAEGSAQIGTTTSGYVVKAGGQLEVSSTGAVRNDPAVGSGATWGRVDSYEGDYLLIPPAGPENRTLRVVVKASQGTLDPLQSDGGIDDISARLYVTPRWLVVPTP